MKVRFFLLVFLLLIIFVSPIKASAAILDKNNNFVEKESMVAQSTQDFDQDGLPDSQELILAQWFVPKLIFDEDEDQVLIDEL